jgi:hypothetical protein
MSIVAFFRPLLRTTVAAGLVIATLSVAHSAPNACALLTAAELSAAMGKPVAGSGSSVAGDGTPGCTYTFGGFDMVTVEIWQAPSAAEAQKKFSTELKGSRSDPNHKTTTVESGLGEGAFAWTMDTGGLKIIGLSAVHGSRFITIGGMSDHPVPLDRLRGLMLKALSR